MAKIRRLYNGTFGCPECEIRYEIEDAPVDELFCESCGGDLEEVGPRPRTKLDRREEGKTSGV